jgi:hypothetical protein
MKKSTTTQVMAEELREIHTKDRKWRKYKVVTAETEPNFIGDYALVEGIAIDLDYESNLYRDQKGYNTHHGITVFGLIDKDYNEVLFRNSSWFDVNPDKLLSDDYYLSFNYEYDYIFRINENEFMAHDGNSRIWLHMKIENGLIYDEFAGTELRTAHNNRILIRNDREESLYNMDSMKQIGRKYSIIYDFLPYTINGETVYLSYVTDVISYYEPYINVNFYIDESNNIVSKIYCNNNGLYYEVDPSGSNYDEVIKKILSDAEKIPDMEARIFMTVNIPKKEPVKCK